MVAKTPTKKPKLKSSKSAKAQTATSKSAKVARPKQLKQQSRPVMTDEKSVKTLGTMTKYIMGLPYSYGIGVLVNFWQMFTKEGKASSLALYNIFAFVILGAIIVWCTRLIKQMNALAFWVFLIFALANFASLMIYRAISSASLFAPIDILLYIFLTLGVFELYKLKNNGTLH